MYKKTYIDKEFCVNSKNRFRATEPVKYPFNDGAL